MVRQEGLRPKHTPKKRVEHTNDTEALTKRIDRVEKHLDLPPISETFPESKQLYPPKPDPNKRAKEAFIKALENTKISW